MTGLRLAVLLGALAGVAGAADLHGVTGFDEFAENHETIAKKLAEHPSLAKDPTFLAHHPSLTHYMHDNPLARVELEAEADDESVAAAASGEEGPERAPEVVLRGRRPLSAETRRAAEAWLPRPVSRVDSTDGAYAAAPIRRSSFWRTSDGSTTGFAR